MDIFTVYIAAFFIVFLVMPVTYFFLRFVLWLILEHCRCCGCCGSSNRNRSTSSSNQRAARSQRQRSQADLYYDRQGNIFTISDDASMNAGANHYADFFYLEPNSDEAARIRAQLEKDEKDLPSYDEVMGMNNLATPTAGIGLSTSSIATNTTTISGNLPPEVPPYSEIDPIAMATIVPALPATASPALPPPTSAAVVDMTGSTGAAPSTSRAAAAAAAAATTTVTIAPIVNNQSSIV